MSHRPFYFYFLSFYFVVVTGSRQLKTSDIRITLFPLFLFQNPGRYHATSDMDGSDDCVSVNKNASNQPVSFVQQLSSRMSVNEGDAVELQVVITGEGNEVFQPADQV